MLSPTRVGGGRGRFGGSDDQTVPPSGSRTGPRGPRGEDRDEPPAVDLFARDRGLGRRGTGPREAFEDDPATPAAGGVAARLLPEFADDDPDDLDDDEHHGAGHRPAEPSTGLFLRRLLIAIVWLACALGLGVGAGLVYEKLHSSGSTAASDTTATRTVTAPSPAGPVPSATPTSVATVPADWTKVTVTSSQARATFAHPNTWTQRVDNTAVMYTEPGGPRMVGVARRTGSNLDGAAAVSKVEALEFNGLAGFAVTGSGEVKDPLTGKAIWEATGTYTRQGVKVAFMLHSVESATPGAQYVLIARAPAASSSELDVLMASLRASFQPAQ